MKQLLKNEKVICYVLILFASIILCMPLINDKIDMTYDDGIQHICRLMGTEQSIKEGQPYATIMSEFCNGFGYSWNIFYSPLTAFLPLIFRIIGFNFVNCIKIFIWICTFLSGIFMFQFMDKVTRNYKVALISSILYIFAPYRLTDMYVRNALAEYASFVFFPLIFNGMYTIFYRKNKNGYLLAVGAIGLMLTHSVITMYMAIFCVIYLLWNFRKLKNKRVLKKIILNTIIILAVTAFFWLPMLHHKLSTDYEVFVPGRMERHDANFGVNILQLLTTTSDNAMIFELGIVTILGLLLCIPVIKRMRKHKNNTIYSIYMFSLIAGLISIIASLDVFPFKHLPHILQMLQFPFRMLTFSSFFFSIVVAINLGVISKKLTMRDVGIVFVLSATIAIALTNHAHYQESFDEKMLWPAVPITENTGRVHAGCASFEYLPSKAYKNLEYIKNRNNEALVIEGNAQLENQNKKGTKLEFDAKYVLAPTKVELPYIYYLGYTVILENDGQKEELCTYETENGFIGIELPIMETGHIKVEYTGTWSMLVGHIISIGILVIWIISVIAIKNKKVIKKIYKKSDFCGKISTVKK